MLIGELAEIDARAPPPCARNHLRAARPPAAPERHAAATVVVGKTPYAVLAREVGVAVDIEAGHAAAARLLDPVLRSEAGGHWDPEARRWRSSA